MVINSERKFVNNIIQGELACTLILLHASMTDILNYFGMVMTLGLRWVAHVFSVQYYVYNRHHCIRIDCSVECTEHGLRISTSVA